MRDREVVECVCHGLYGASSCFRVVYLRAKSTLYRVRTGLHWEGMAAMMHTHDSRIQRMK